MNSKLLRVVKRYCPLCDKEHEVEERERLSSINIKGECVKYKEVYFECKETNEEENEFVSAKMMDENLLRARDVYRKEHNMLTSLEIKQIRQKYGVTQAEFSYMLGLGEVTITRYETKLIQDTTYDTMMKLMDKNAMFALESLEANKETIKNVILEEKDKFEKTLERGEREFNKIVNRMKNEGQDTISGQDLFTLYETYGFPPEVTQDLAREAGLKVDTTEFDKLFKEHQEKSRMGSEQKFKGGLAGTGEQEVRYHTATHLLNAALKVILGKDVHQKGSNITPERMRFDFSCDHKLTDEEKKKVEDLVNEWISRGLDVKCEEMKKDDAIKSGAECMFIEKYPDIVTVYSIGNDKETVSKELCGGPHVKNTSELGHFKIKKEEASSAGVRRIKAILE